MINKITTLFLQIMNLLSLVYNRHFKILFPPRLPMPLYLKE